MSFPVQFIITLSVMLAVIFAMGIGVLFGRRALKGSCGGLNTKDGCALCSGNCPKARQAQS